MHKWIVIFYFTVMIDQCFSQFKMSTFAPMPTIHYNEQLAYASIRNKNQDIYISGRNQSQTVIQKWDVRNSSNVILDGSYYYSGEQNFTYSYVYFFKGYILACANLYPPRLFNQSTKQYIDTLTVNLTFGRGTYISSKDQFFFGTNTGLTGYFSVSNLPNPNVSPVYLHNSTNPGQFVFVQKSRDQLLVSTSFITSNTVNIWRVSDWTLLQTLNVGYSGSLPYGVFTQGWSSDSRYLMVFIYYYQYIEIYDRDNNWTLHQNITIGFKNVRNSFYYPQTNVQVALSQFSQSIITINWYDFSVNISHTNISGWKMYLGQSEDSFTVFNQYPINTAWFFNIEPFCASNTFYNIPTKTCVSCATNCNKCLNSINCTVCAANYELKNGSCNLCGNSTFYNSTSFKCDSCSINCLICSSSLICTTCSANYFLVNSSCINCPVGYIYNFTSWVCVVNCTSNCNVCSSNNTCSVCISNYQQKNGTCSICSNSTFYNSLTYKCDSCPLSCLSCSALTSCTQCVVNYALYQGSCITQSEYDNLTAIPEDNYNWIYQMAMSITVENEAVQTLNKIPGSRRVFRNIFAFFLNIDHLWLYLYHKRQYGYYVTRLLTSIQHLQEQKWNIVSNQIFKKSLNIDMNDISSSLNIKQNLTSWKYLQIQQQSSSFLQNSLDYIFLNIPLVILIFFLFKLLFRLLFKYQISILWRQYSFNGYLLLMLIEGNCQSFSYLFMYDCKNLVNKNFYEKFFNGMTILLFMVFMVQLIAGYFLFKATYAKNAKYFYDNCSNTLQGTTHIFVQNALLNFLLGSAHIYLEDSYNLQLTVLFTIQFLFLSSLVTSIRKVGLFEYRYVEWITMLSSLFRILLIFTYYCDQSFPGQYDIIEQIQMYLIVLYLFNWMIFTFIGYLILVTQLVRFIAARLQIKNNLEIFKLNPYLEKYKNLARIEKNKKKIKIQALDFNDSSQNSIKKRKNIIYEYKLGVHNNEEISIVHKVKGNGVLNDNNRFKMEKFKRLKKGINRQNSIGNTNLMFKQTQNFISTKNNIKKQQAQIDQTAQNRQKTFKSRKLNSSNQNQNIFTSNATAKSLIKTTKNLKQSLDKKQPQVKRQQKPQKTLKTKQTNLFGLGQYIHSHQSGQSSIDKHSLTSFKSQLKKSHNSQQNTNGSNGHVKQKRSLTSKKTKAANLLKKYSSPNKEKMKQQQKDYSQMDQMEIRF